MSDAATPAVVCVTTGAIAGPFCEAFGFDPTLLFGGLLGGFLGCVIAQTLIPDKEDVPFRRLLALTVGSVLLATLVTMVGSPWVVRVLSLTDVPAGAVRLVFGAVIGACAQPLAMLGKKKLLRWFSGLGNKESERV